MSKAFIIMGQSGTTLSTLGVYITTKWVSGSEPLILEVRELSTQNIWTVGRSRQYSDIVLPNPFISQLNGTIEYDGDKWFYTHYGSNDCWYSKTGSSSEIRIKKGRVVEITLGTVLYFLYKEPAYAFEFFPGLEKEDKDCELSEGSTKLPSGPTKNVTDLKYIDTPVEFITYAFYTVMNASKFQFVVVVAALLIGIWLWRK